VRRSGTRAFRSRSQVGSGCSGTPRNSILSSWRKARYGLIITDAVGSLVYCNSAPGAAGMPDFRAIIPADTGKSGRAATERSSMARPRYQEGSLSSRQTKTLRPPLERTSRWKMKPHSARGNDRIRQSNQKAESARDSPGSSEFSQSATAQAESNHNALGIRESGVETECGPGAEKIVERIYSFNLDNHVLPAVGDLPIRDLGVAHVEACLSKFKQKGHATSTLRSVRAAFSNVASIGRERRLHRQKQCS
jgi:hypothetical protein